MATKNEKRKLQLTEMPAAWTVTTEKLSFFCSFCLKTGSAAGGNVDSQADPKLMRCSKCKTLFYCGGACQKSDWSSHRSECKRISRQAASGEPVADDFLRLFCRVVDEFRRNSPQSSLYPSEDRSFDVLVSHETQIDEEEFQSLRQKYKNFAACGKKAAASEDESGAASGKVDLKRIYGKLKVNSFGIKNEELQSIGVGLYVNLCRLDHSCVPNVRILFRGKEAFVAAVGEGTETFLHTCDSYDHLRHSYIDNIATRDERQAILAANYYFDCRCAGGCAESLEAAGGRDSHLMAVCCDQDGGCDGIIPWTDANRVCLTCKRSLRDPETAKMVVDLTKEMLSKMAAQTFLTADKQFELCSTTAAMQTGVLHEYNAWRMRTVRYAYESCVKLGRFADAAVYGEDVLRVYRRFYGRNDPYLTVFEKNLGVVYANAKMFDKAAEILGRAEERLAALYGGESNFYEKVECVMNKVNVALRVQNGGRTVPL